MNFVNLLVALSLLLCIRLSTQWIATGFYHNDAFPSKCYINAGLILAPGESAKDPEMCAEINCGGGEKGVAEIHGCPSYAPPEHCKLGELVDDSLEYPICCVREVICEDAERRAYALEHQKMMQSTFQESYQSKVQKSAQFLDSNKL